MKKIGLVLLLALAPLFGLKAQNALAACYTNCSGTILHKQCATQPGSSGWTQCTVPDGSHCEFGGLVCFT